MLPTVLLCAAVVATLGSTAVSIFYSLKELTCLLRLQCATQQLPGCGLLPVTK